MKAHKLFKHGNECSNFNPCICTCWSNKQLKLQLTYCSYMSTCMRCWHTYVACWPWWQLHLT